jgi:hypothetical protein
VHKGDVAVTSREELHAARLSGKRLLALWNALPGVEKQTKVGTVDEVASVMGWQRHTVRGLFSGTLKKKLGLTLASATEERGRVYRIAAAEQA